MCEAAVPWFPLAVAGGAAAPQYVLSHCLAGWPVVPSSPSAEQQQTARSLVKAELLWQSSENVFTFTFCGTRLLLKLKESQI